MGTLPQIRLAKILTFARTFKRYSVVFCGKSCGGIRYVVVGRTPVCRAIDYGKVWESMITGLENNAKVTLYEATKLDYTDGSIKSGKAVKSITATAENAGAILSGIYLDSSKDYYVVVQAASTNGSKNTNYDLVLEKMDEFTNGSGQATGAVSKDNAATYSFTAVDGATDVTLTIADASDKAIVTLYKVNTSNGKYTKVKSLTATGKNLTVSTGELCLEAGVNYVVEVTAPNAKNGAVVNYTLDLSNWKFETYESTKTVDDNLAEVKEKDAAIVMGPNGVSDTIQNAVWKVGKVQSDWDNVDYFKVVVDDAGAYTLDLAGINGNSIKVSIGTVDSKGKFKSLQSAAGAKNADSLVLSRNLTEGTYYVKVESVGSNNASGYSLTMTNNSKRVDFSNDDDSWKLVAGDIDSLSYDTDDRISDWVGFGDAVDVFKIRLEDIANTYDDNHQVCFGGAEDSTTQAYLRDKLLNLSLVDANGKSVALNFDKTTGEYTTKTVLMAGVDYYLTVKNSNATKNPDLAYDIDITLA